MDSWKKFKLGQICELINGRAFKPTEWSEEGLPIIRIENLNNENADYNHCNFDVNLRYYINNGDILISWSGTPGTSFGIFIWQRGKAVLNQHIFKVILDKKLITEEFFYHSYNSILDKMIGSSHGSGGLQHITRKELINLELFIPSGEEQTKIAAILSKTDKAIEQTERIIAKYQRIKTGLMQDLLTKGIDENGNIRSEETHEFKDSPVGRIPKEWDVCRMVELTSKIVDGVHHKPNYYEEGIPFITVSDLTAGDGIDFKNTRYISLEDHGMFLKRADPLPNDVLVTKDGTLGVARIVPINSPEFSIFVSVAQLRPIQNKCTSGLIWSFFESGEFKRQLGSLSAGTGLAHIHLEHFREFQVRTPPIHEQKEIIKILTRHQSSIKKQIGNLNKLKKLKTGLMQDLLTGKVRCLNLDLPD